MSYRNEFKSRLSCSDALLLKTQLLNNGMTSLFPRRVIRSLYFDNDINQMFTDSEQGILPRSKIRIRSYPETNMEKYSLEKKVSSIEGRFKTSSHLSLDSFNKKILTGILDNQYGLCTPKVYIEYEREYFSFSSVRVTFDRNIRFWNKNKHCIYNEEEEVVEIKCSHGSDPTVMLKLGPLTQSRFSKYSRAMKNVFQLIE